MKILFSPSEGKKDAGEELSFSNDSFLFPELYNKRIEVVDRYNNFINIASDEELSKLFGIKDVSKFEIYKKDIYKQPTMKVIQRYSGVAFDYLDFKSLNQNQRNYIENNTIIFSNLFGPIGAGDMGLVGYKLKQGEKIDGFSPENFYKKHFTKALDELLENEPFIDLRAGFYNKFYKPSSPYITIKFLKNAKVVSHWTKAYRGLILRELSKNNIQNIQQFMKMEIDNLQVKEILKKGIHTEIVFDIV